MNKKNYSEHQRYQFLSDEPSDNDDFGAHHRVANAINQLIKTNDGAKTIALIGEWGAGKSTTIKQLHGLLDDETKIFTYDAWVHSGDQLRKSFLNELIDFLIEKNFLQNSSTWENEKEILAGRLKKITKNTEPTFTTQGKVIIPLILALPVSTVIFNNLIQGYIKDQYFFTPYHIGILVFTIISFIVMMAPLFIVTFHSIFGDDSHIFSLIMNKSGFKETTITTEQPEATTIEFQDLFKKLMKSALDEENNSQKKIIIVLDNLDRVDDIEAQNIWSLLRGFIDNPNYKKDHWINNLWAIVPLATQNANNAYLNEKTTTIISKSDQVNADNPFFEKVFQVRFYLPPIVHSDWKRSFNNLLLSTFNGLDLRDKEIISRLFESYIFESCTKSPTPREIKLFINDLATMALLWGNKEKISVYAAYVLTHKVHKNEFLNQLRVGRAVTGTFKRILREDPSRKFAAFFFNIDDLKKANAMLLKLPVEMALRENSGRWMLDELIDNPGLVDVLKVTVDTSIQSWAASSPTNFFNAVMNLTDLINKSSISNESLNSQLPELEELKTLLVQSMIDALEYQFEYYPYDVEGATDAIFALSVVDSSTQLISSILNSFKKISNAGLNDISTPEFGNRTDGLRVITALKRLYSNEAIKSTVIKLKNNELKLPISFSRWLELCGDFSEDNEFLRIIYPLEFSKSNTENEIVEKAISEEPYDERFVKLLMRERAWSESSTLSNSVFRKMQTYLERAPDGEKSFSILKDTIKLKIMGFQQADNLLQRVSESGAIFKTLSQATRTGNRIELIIPSLVTILLKNSKLKQGTIEHDVYFSVRNFFNITFKSADSYKQFDSILRFLVNNEFISLLEEIEKQDGEYAHILSEYGKRHTVVIKR